MQNSQTHALIDGPGTLAPLHGAMVKPARLRLVWSADGDAPAMQVAARRKDVDAAVAEIDYLLIF
jgi:hypothetical protein